MNQDKLIEILNASNFEEQIKSLSYEEKIDIFSCDGILQSFVFDKAVELNIKLFNPTESLKLVKESMYLFDFRGFRDKIEERLSLIDLDDETLIETFSHYDDYRFVQFIKDPEVLFKHIDSFEFNLKQYAFGYLTDELLEKLINRKEYKEHLSTIISYFKSDEYKLRYIKRIDKSNRSYILKRLQPDLLKKQITPFAVDKGELISGLPTDQEKEEYLEFYKLMLSSEDKAQIISSFKSEDYIRRNIKHLQSEKALYLFISYSYNKLTDEFYIKLINSINNEKYLRDIIERLLNSEFENRDYIKKLIDKIYNPKIIFELYDDINNEEILSYLAPRLNQKYIHKYVKENMEYLKDYHILLKLEDRTLLFEALQHYDFDKDYNDDMLPLFEIIAKKYNLNVNHLIELTKITGCSILRQITNENIINAINLDEENFNRYLQIFDKKNMELTSNSISSILNSLLNKKFSIEYPDRIQIFIDTLHAVDDGNDDKVLENICKVLNGIDVDKYNINPQRLLRGILAKEEEIVKIYNKMTYEYLTNLRNYYVNNLLNKSKMDIMYATYDLNDLAKFFVKNLPEDLLLKIIKENVPHNIDAETKKIIENEELLLKLIRFKKNPSLGLSDDIKPVMKYFNILLKSVLDDYNYCNVKHAKLDGLKIEYKMPEFDRRLLIDVMANIDVNKLQDLVFNNPELFEELLKYLDRYDMLGWGNQFTEIAMGADVDMSANIVATLISNFELIMKMKKEKEQAGGRFTFVSELALADCLDSDASIYSAILGRDDYRLIRQNPGPNASTKGKQYRLDKALDYLKIMHNRKYITVPPVDKEFKLKNGKSLNIIIGNTNDTINLTYGERTGACMRIGGAGGSLFDFCMRNENGFHISFNNPNTGELVSRVTCYRNGNTVFLNQVRYPLDRNYSYDDIKEATRLIGKEIIELTKDSQYPVLNVVTSDNYVFNNSKTENMHCKSPTKGFIPPFYTDINEDVVVIATSTGSLSPVELGPSKTEKYEVGRKHIRKYDMAKAGNAINHIEAIDKYLKGTPLDEIELEERIVVFAYAGEDWYVAVTNNGEIINYIADTSRNKSAATKEMEKYLKIIQDELKYISIEEKAQVKK